MEHKHIYRSSNKLQCDGDCSFSSHSDGPMLIINAPQRHSAIRWIQIVVGLIPDLPQGRSRRTQELRRGGGGGAPVAYPGFQRGGVLKVRPHTKNEGGSPLQVRYMCVCVCVCVWGGGAIRFRSDRKSGGGGGGGGAKVGLRLTSKIFHDVGGAKPVRLIYAQ